MEFPDDIKNQIKEFSKPRQLLYPPILNNIYYYKITNKYFLSFENGRIYYSPLLKKLLLVSNKIYFYPEISLSLDRLNKIINEKFIWNDYKQDFFWDFGLSYEILIKRCGRYLLLIYYKPDNPKYDEDEDEDIGDIGGHQIFIPIYMIIGLINNLDIKMKDYTIDTHIEDLLKNDPSDDMIVKLHFDYVDIKKYERMKFSNVKYKLI
jgi:hypothetical protein